MAVDALKAIVTMSAAAPADTAAKPVHSGASEAEADPASVAAAVEQLQSHLDSVSSKSEFRVDYLSGLNVVTIRSGETGDVIRQMPSRQAVEVARLIGEGGGTLNVLDTFV